MLPYRSAHWHGSVASSYPVVFSLPDIHIPFLPHPAVAECMRNIGAAILG